MPTRLLGWMLVAVFAVELVSPIAHEVLLIYGLVFLFAGILVLRGSRMAIRFSIFLTILCGFAILSVLLPEALLLRPVEIRGAWRDYRDIEFWAFGVSPLMLLAAGFLLAVAALRSRRIPFWTKPVRIAAGILGLMLLAKLGVVGWKWNQQHRLASDLGTGIDAGRKAFRELGRTSVPDPAWSHRLAGFPNIERVLWEPSRGHLYPLHVPYNPYFYPPGEVAIRPQGREEKYSEWMRDARGEWGRLHVHLIIPEP